jgi:hypothetical protein
MLGPSSDARTILDPVSKRVEWSGWVIPRDCQSLPSNRDVNPNQELAGRTLGTALASTRQFVPMLLRFMAWLAAEHDVPLADREALHGAAADPDSLLDHPGFCLRELIRLAVIVLESQV